MTPTPYSIRNSDILCDGLLLVTCTTPDQAARLLPILQASTSMKSLLDEMAAHAAITWDLEEHEATDLHRHWPEIARQASVLYTEALPR